MATTTERDGMILETRIEYGHAARKNRGHYSGQKIHRIRSEYVVGIVPGSEHRPGTYGASFIRKGKPILFHAEPACGCTMGQNAAQPSEKLTAENVTCEKCKNR